MSVNQALVSFAVLLAAEMSARADTIMLMTVQGAADESVIVDVSSELEAAGHTIMNTGASLEDSALMLGCDPSETSCLASVVTAAGAQGAVVLPSEAGELRVWRGDKERRASVVASATPFQWRVALSEAFGLPAPVDLDAKVEVQVAPPVPPPKTFFDVSAVQTHSWVVLGSGVVATGVGLMFLASASGKQVDVNRHPVDTAEDLEALQDLEASGASDNRLGRILLVAGGVATMSGIGLALWDMNSAQTERKPILVPSVSSTTVGLAVRWTAW